MKPDASTLSTLRLILLGLTGLACFAFSALVLIQQRPDPFFWWVPGALGLVSTDALFALAWLAGAREAGRAYDELNAELTRRAAAGAYWISVALFFPFALAMAWGWTAPGPLMAAFGTAMGGTYLLRFVWLDLRLR